MHEEPGEPRQKTSETQRANIDNSSLLRYQRRGIRGRLLLDSTRQSDSGLASQQDQGAAGADLSESGTQMGVPRLPHLLLPVLRSSEKRDGRAMGLRNRAQEFSAHQRD